MDGHEAGRESRRHRWYLAGKISEMNDWRLPLVPGLDATAREWGEKWEEKLYDEGVFPVLERALYGIWDYVGPFFALTGGHGGDPHSYYMEGYGPGDHGRTGTCAFVGHGIDGRDQIHSACLYGIRNCDRVFAWIDSTDCYGTLVEIGYARGLGKEVEIAFSRRLEKHWEDLWFVDAMRNVDRLPDTRIVADTAADAFTMAHCAEIRAQSEASHREFEHELALEAGRLRNALAEKTQAALPPATRLDPQRAFSALQKREIYLKSNGHCQTCGQTLGSDWHADHVVPHSRGGRTEVVNGQALCQPCNSRKRDKVLTVDE